MNEFEAQCTLCKRTLNLGTLGVRELLKVSSKVTLSHTSVCLCHKTRVQVHPVLLNLNSASHSQATLKPSSAQLHC